MIWHQISALAWKIRLQTKHSLASSCCKMFLSVSMMSACVAFTALCYIITHKGEPLGDDTNIVPLIAFGALSAACLLLMEDIISKVMLEKTKNIREHLRIQGVSESCHAIAYLIHYSMVAAIMLSVCLFFATAYGFVCVQLTCITFFILVAAVAVAYAQCAFFDNSTVARFSVLLTWFTPMLPIMAWFYCKIFARPLSANTQSVLGKSALVLQFIHPSALWGYNFNFSGFSSSPNSSDFSMSLNQVMLVAITQTIFYFVLGIYLHLVVPSANSATLPWNFFFKRARGKAPEVGYLTEGTTAAIRDPTRFETTDTNRPAGVKFQNVVKEFDDGAVKAINDVSLDIYRNEVFALLGHNGAGKTTLLECLVGLQTHTRGRIILNGQDSEDPTARQSVGYCPQFDAFYPNFKPLEILEFHGRLRGKHAAEAAHDSESMLEHLGLLRKAHSVASSLSGGQMRKLSVGMAFIGGCNTVVLDEPSSGLDLESSLELWSVIRNLRQSKTVLLTTHNMNEAEALGDRIGIMSFGSIQCLGTPLFLKSNLGSGYRISFRFASGSEAQSSAQITSLLKDLIPSATRISSKDSLVQCFQIPNDDARCISDLLFQLESPTSNLNLESYHLAPTRLEDVFLRIAREHEDQLMSGSTLLKPLPAFTPVATSSLTHIRSILVVLGSHLLSDYAYHVSLVFPIIFAIISFSTSENFLHLGLITLIYFTASCACSNIRHFSHTDIRLQLDIFGIPWYTYTAVTIVFNLLQICAPLVAYCICCSFTSDDSLVDFTFCRVLGYGFNMVGFMALVRSLFPNIAGWKLTSYPVIIFNICYTVVSFFHPGAMEYVAEASQILPIMLYYHGRIDFYIIPDTYLLLAHMVIGTLYFIGAVVLDFCSLHPNRFVSSQAVSSSTFDEPVDDDVEAEAKRLGSGCASDLLEVRDLTKSYNRVAAVRGISVGVSGGQSLAFLGVNGSGKSSSIRCMLGISSVSSGEIRVAGVNVTEDEFGARRNIGYVPQHDKILIGRMTGYQQLMFVAKLAGVPKDVQNELVDTMIANIDLSQSAAHRRIDTYSGGMKRKLCVALALLMNRKVVLLDEPSTGVDPASRRRFWSMFADVQADPNRCLLLTTHQLEEAEAVCDRISIMVNGRIVCLGSASQLKHKFGNHFQIDLNCSSRDVLGIVRQWITAKYPTATLVEADGVHLRFWVRKQDCSSFAELFAFVNDHDQVPVQEVFVGHSTMDQIFIALAHKAKRMPNGHYIQIDPFS